jgi:hypothetical protein
MKAKYSTEFVSLLQPAIGPYSEPDESTPTSLHSDYLRFILILSSLGLCLRPISDLLPFKATSE